MKQSPPLSHGNPGHRRLPQLPLRIILIVSFVVPIVGTVAMVSYLSFKNGQQAVNELASDLRNEITARIQDRMQTFVATPHLTNSIIVDAIQGGQVNVDNFASMERFLWQLAKQFHSVSYISFGFASGDYVGAEPAKFGNPNLGVVETKKTGITFYTYSTNAQGKRQSLISKIPNFQTRQRPWYLQGVEAGQATWISYLWIAPKVQLGLGAIQPVYRKNGTLSGVLITDVTLADISKFLGSLKIGKTGQTFLIERTGELIASSGGEAVFKADPITKLPLRLHALESNSPLVQVTAQHLKATFGDFKHITSSQQLQMDWQGKRQFIQVTPFSDSHGLDWLIVVVVPESDFMEQVNANTHHTFWLGLGALGGAIAIVILLANSITRSVRKLSTASHKIAAGNWQQQVSLSSIRELGILGEAFNSMSHQILQAREQLEDYARSLETKVQERTSALTASQERFDLAMQGATEGLWDWNIQTNEAYLSPRHKEMLGYADDELPNHPSAWLRLLHPSDRHYVLAESKRYLKHQIPRYETTFRMRHRDGHYLWILSRGAALWDEQGNAIRVIGTHVDITQRMQAEAALQNSQQQLQRQNAALVKLTRNKALSQGDWQTAVQEITQVAAHTIGAERASVWLYRNKKSKIYCVDLFEQAASRHSAGAEIAAVDYPDYFQALEADQIIAAHDAYTDPRTQEFTIPYLQPQGIAAMLDAPIRLGEKTIGVLCLERTGTPPAWTLEEQGFVRSLADVVSLAIEAHQRQRAETTLRNANAEMTALFTAMEDLVLVRDAQGRCTKILTPQTKNLLYKPAHEMLNKAIEQVFPEELAKAFVRYIHQALKTQQTVKAEYKLNIQGKEIWLNASISPINAESVVWVIRDVTTSKQIQEELQAANAEMKALFNSMDQLVMVFDRQGRHLKIPSGRNQRLLYTPINQRIGKTLHEVFPPDTADYFMGYIQQTLDTQQTFRADYSLTIRGEEVWSDTTISPIDDETVIWVVNDVTERKQAEEALKHSEKKYRDLIQSANCIILRWDTNGNILFLNQYGQRFFGYSENEIIGLSIIGTLVAETETSGRNLRNMMADICHNPDPYQLNENENTRRNGEKVWIQWANKSILNSQGELIEILSIGVDITARKQAEEELRQAKQAADAASKAKSEFLANMSHELRSPLNAVIGFAQLMNRSPDLSDDQRENVAIILRSSEHLLTLINNVLDLSKIEAGRITLNPSNFDFYRLLEDLEDMFSLKTEEKQLALKFELTPHLPRYLCTDQVKLRQVLINLLSNALKFTEQGSITLRVGLEEEISQESAFKRSSSPSSLSSLSSLSSPSSSFSHPPIFPSPHSLYFEVEDTGIGIPPDEVDKLFEAFSQTQSGQDAQEGTGLGLAISRKFVQLMGGEINISSQLERGTIFRFTINAQAVEAADVLTSRTSFQVVGLEPGQPSYRILVVDDKPINRQLLVKLLTPLGFEVREAANGKEAIAQWEAWDPHLIWMDMRMPVMDGYEATKQIKATTKGQAIAVIALTASALEEQQAVVLSAGCDDFVRKPFRESDIFTAMQKHIGVRYLYADNLPTTDLSPEVTPQVALTPGHFHTLPSAWIADLYQAFHNVDLELATSLIEQIRNENPTLAIALHRCLNNFEYEQVLQAIQAIANPEESP